MAFDIARFSVFSGGQTGAGLLAKYDGSGTDDEGGDTASTLRGKNFFDHQAIKDALHQARDPSTGGGLVNGTGLLCLLHSRTGLEWRLLIFDAADTDQVTTVGGGGAHTWALE